MINKLIEGISKKLYEVFGNVKIYVDEIPQNFVTPSFFVKCLTHNDNLMLFDTKRKITKFDILYFPTENNLNKEYEVNNVLAVLVDSLNIIEADGHKVKGLNITTEKVDGVLHFFVDYNITLIKQGENIKMENLKERTDVNG